MADDFCLIHGYGHMVRRLGDPIERCTRCEAIDKIITDIAELPDRTSPEGQPEMMLVTAAELRDLINQHLT